MTMQASRSLVDKIYTAFCGDVHFAAPIKSLQRKEFELVRGVLQVLQGCSSSLFYWDRTGQKYSRKRGIYVSHLSHTSLGVILDQFLHAATCLQLVEIFLDKVDKSGVSPSPTLRAFSCSVSAWLGRLRDFALKEEEKISNSNYGSVPTLLGLANSLSSVCAGAEYLLQIVDGSIPQVYFKCDSSFPASSIAVHILDHLFKRFNEICLVEGGEEDAYRMVLYIFVGSLLPYIECLDSWIFEGILDDPYEEMFFYANKVIAIDEAEFWEKSYLLRPICHKKLDVGNATGVQPLTGEHMAGTRSTSASISDKGKEQIQSDVQVFPLFLKDIAKEIISVGKSLQLFRHAPPSSSAVLGCHDKIAENISQLSLSEVFSLSLAALIGHGDHMSEFFWQDDGVVSAVGLLEAKETLKGNDQMITFATYSEKIWYKFLVDSMPLRGGTDAKCVDKEATCLIDKKEEDTASSELPTLISFCPENPVITVSQRVLHANSNLWNTLNLYRNFSLPPLNDEDLRKDIFGESIELAKACKQTNYAFGFTFGEAEFAHLEGDAKMLESLLPFPTLLPSFKEDLRVSELLPFQKSSTLLSKVLSWIQIVEPKATPLPVIILQECLLFYIKKQVDCIGSQILTKLLFDWRLMDELGVLRAIYLLGSGDLLQHFLTVTFNKLDKGESWDDDFELNTVLQESIRNSADGALLSSQDSLVVSVSKTHDSSGDEQHNTSFTVTTPRRIRGESSGINGLDSLKFIYKVPWPLELIANTEAVKKYNQVMSFLMKVKRAKFVLDKARRLMWKERGTATVNRKRSWLVEQKLLHFVDAFHQYVMDRVYHSAWHELCDGMRAARSLDEVLEVHEDYLLSIQRQCFVVPDKLSAMIASRINSILGLALDFYSTQQTLCSGGTVSAIKTRCEKEVNRIDRDFDECIAFLLRVLSFKLNVGQFPHLADLVTRINYNYFYISDTGHSS